jgi:norsolorinic acid ketoreductase
MATATTYLITGGNRGIGAGLVAQLLLRPQTIVITLVRNPAHETSHSLSSLPQAEISRLIVERYDTSPNDSAFFTIKVLQCTYKIDALNVVIANSRIISHYAPVARISASDLEPHFQINAVAPILLFHATLPLLRKSSQAPKLFTISTSVASLALMGKVSFDEAVYGMSKVAVNYAMHKLHFEYEREGIVMGTLHPGWVRIAMEEFAADNSGLVEVPPLGLRSRWGVLLGVIDATTRERTRGRFLGWDGKELPW